VASVLSKIPGLADRDIPVPVLHPLVFLTGTESHPKLKQVLESTGAISGLKLVPTLNSYIGDMSDHGVFRENGVPYFFLSCGHWAHYHKKTDTPDRLNYRKMARITLLTCRILSELDSQTLRRTGNKECVCDIVCLGRRNDIDVCPSAPNYSLAVAIPRPLFSKRESLTSPVSDRRLGHFARSFFSGPAHCRRLPQSNCQILSEKRVSGTNFWLLIVAATPADTRNILIGAVLHGLSSIICRVSGGAPRAT
jgi:hypothetical protein